MATALVIPPDAPKWRQLLIYPDFAIIPIRANEASDDHATTDSRTFDANQRWIEHALRDFVRAAVSRLSEAVKDQAPEWEADSQWEHGTDGIFREYTKRTRALIW